MADMNIEFLRLLGLAKRASRAELGEDGVSDAIAAGKARVIFLASDAAANSVRRVSYMTEDSHAVVVSVPFTKAELGAACGRSSCAMMAITETGLAASAVEKLSLLSPGTYDQALQLVQAKDARIRSRRGKKKRTRKTNL